MSIVDATTARLPPLPKRTVDVPEMGGEVVVRGLLLTDRLNLGGMVANGVDKEIMARTLACTVTDANGAPIWTEAQWEQFGAVEFNAAVRLFMVAQELSGLTATVEGDPAKNV
jgi:hypothetical protein